MMSVSALPFANRGAEAAERPGTGIHASPRVSRAVKASSKSSTALRAAVTAAIDPNVSGYASFDIRSRPLAGSPKISGSTVPFGLTPAQIRGAYGLGQYGAASVTYNGVQADGSGQTIAIVDAYDDPNALADLNAFSSRFNLPQFTGLSGAPIFSKLNQGGQTTSLPGTDPGGPNNANGTWEQEESLDIEWAHAMAPMANIILVEATSPSNTNLYTAVNSARSIAGVVAISMSWSGNESSSATTNDSKYFVTPAGHVGGGGIAGGLTFLASAGDSGAYSTGTTLAPQYPATSPNVVAVGGTRLGVSGNNYVSEVTWGNGTNSASKGGGGGGNQRLRKPTNLPKRRRQRGFHHQAHLPRHFPRSRPGDRCADL